MNRKHLFGFFLGVSLSSVALGATVNVVNLGTTLSTQAVESIGDSVSLAPTLPLSISHGATQGGSHGTTTYDFSESGNMTTFNFQFEHTHAGTQNSFAKSIGFFQFSIDEPTQPITYEFSGTYQAPSDNRLWLDVRFLDVSTGLIFREFHQSLSTLNESFVIGGGLDQGESNSLIGNPTGNLIDGHTYQVNYELFHQRLGGPSGGTTATGDLTLKISTPSIVPLPAAAWMAVPMLGGLGVTQLIRRRRLAA